MYRGVPWWMRMVLDAPLLLVKHLVRFFFRADLTNAVRLLFMALMLLAAFVGPLVPPFLLVVYSPTGLKAVLQHAGMPSAPASTQEPTTLTVTSSSTRGEARTSRSRAAAGFHWASGLVWFYLLLATGVSGIVAGVLGGMIFSAGMREPIVPDKFEQTLLLGCLVCTAGLYLLKGVNLVYDAWLVGKLVAMMAWKSAVVGAVSTQHVVRVPSKPIDEPGEAPQTSRPDSPTQFAAEDT